METKVQRIRVDMHTSIESIIKCTHLIVEFRLKRKGTLIFIWKLKLGKNKNVFALCWSGCFEKEIKFYLLLIKKMILISLFHLWTLNWKNSLIVYIFYENF